jgi:hypothetical protein
LNEDGCAKRDKPSVHESGARHRFSARVIKALLDAHPHAFDPEAPA